MRREAFLIGCYPDDERKTKILIDLLINLRKFDCPVLISTHYPLSQHIQSLSDYVIYDKNNPFDDRLRLNHDFHTSDFDLYAPFEERYHAVAGMSAFQNGVDFCRSKFDFVYWLEYDISLDLEKYINLVRQYNKPINFFNWRGDKNSIATNNCAIEVNYFNKLWNIPIYTCDNYLNLVEYAASKTDQSRNIIIESLAMRLLKANNLLKDCHIFSEEEEKELIKSLNLCATTSMNKMFSIKTYLCSTTDNRIVLFVANPSGKDSWITMKSESISDRFLLTSQVRDEYTNFVTLKWFILNKQGSLEIDIEVNNDKRVFDLETTEIFKDASFKFHDNRVVQKT